VEVVVVVVAELVWVRVDLVLLVVVVAVVALVVFLLLVVVFDLASCWPFVLHLGAHGAIFLRRCAHELAYVCVFFSRNLSCVLLSVSCCRYMRGLFDAVFGRASSSVKSVALDPHKLCTHGTAVARAAAKE
jgi:hypothetical protein